MTKLTKGIFILLIINACNPKVQENITFAQINTFQLAEPQLIIDSLLFQNKATVELNFSYKNAEIRYSLDESEVTESSNLYTKPIEINHTKTVKAKVFHKDFLPSSTISATVLKVENVSRIVKISSETEPNKSYYGNGFSSLTDLQKGTTNFRNGNLWSGFQEKEIVFDVDFQKEKVISKITLSLLKDHNSWIFLPQQIEVLVDGRIVGKQIIIQPKGMEECELIFIPIELNKSISSINNLQIRVINLDGIPDFHTGKGHVPWLFIDEILFE